MKQLPGIIAAHLAVGFLRTAALSTDPPFTYTSYVEDTDFEHPETRTVKPGITPRTAGTSHTTLSTTLTIYPEPIVRVGIITIITVILPPNTLPEDQLEPILPAPELWEKPMTQLVYLEQPIRFTGPASCQFPYTVDGIFSIAVPTQLVYVLSPTSTYASTRTLVTTYTGASWCCDKDLPTFTSVYTELHVDLTLYLSSNAVPATFFGTEGFASEVAQCLNPTASGSGRTAAVPPTQTLTRSGSSRSSPRWGTVVLLWVGALTIARCLW